MCTMGNPDLATPRGEEVFRYVKLYQQEDNDGT